jgi:hypothetical protein
MRFEVFRRCGVLSYDTVKSHKRLPTFRGNLLNLSCVQGKSTKKGITLKSNITLHGNTSLAILPMTLEYMKRNCNI